jgi:dihydroorotate dehydrogenase electron transfer subunit
MICADVRVKGISFVSKDCYKIILSVPQRLDIKPGQFAHIKIGIEPLVRRPFTIYDFSNREVTLLVKLVGQGTRQLCRKKCGEGVGFLGPLGNGFSINSKANNHIIVAGGIGIAPFYLLAKRLIKNNHNVRLLFGAKNKGQLYALDDFESMSIPIDITTEDGSLGKKGVVSELLEGYLKKRTQIYACGPEGMLKVVYQMARRRKISCHVCLERMVVCGFGACGSCVIKVKLNRGNFRYSRICVEGPVYQAERVVW